MPELMSDVSIVFLEPVDDQPREDEALCEGNLVVRSGSLIFLSLMPVFLMERIL